MKLRLTVPRRQWCGNICKNCDELTEPLDITIKTLFADLLDFVYPPQCQICQSGFVATEGNIWVCDICRQQLVELPGPRCPVCRSLLPDTERPCRNCHKKSALCWLYSLGTYDDHYSHLIKSFKYGPKPGLGALLGKMLAAKIKEFPQIAAIEAVCAVPIHRQKESQRGFNQAEIIARAVAPVLDLPYYPAQLVQVKKNRDQIGLTIEERFHNVQGVYSAAEDFQLQGKAVLLIDDVTTSGATLNSAAMVLSAAGVKSVAAATIALALEDGIDPAALFEHLPEDF